MTSPKGFFVDQNEKNLVGEGKTNMTSEKRGQLRAGASKVDITPRELAGLTNLWGRPFEGVHDPIFLRALVLDNGQKTVAVVAADLVEFGDTCEIRQRIEHEVGIPADQIIITASHDHNAPRVGAVTPGATARPGGPATEKYTQDVYAQVVNAVREAKAALQPARIGIGSGTVDINTNRDVFTPQGWKIGTNPDGLSDKTVWVIKVETMTGEPIALMMNYAVHSVALGPENRLVTGDLAGAAERYVEKCFQDKIVALWTLGAAGDQNPKYVGWNSTSNHRDTDTDYVLANAQGVILGEEVIQVAGLINNQSSEVRIQADERVVSCPARILPDGEIKVKRVDTVGVRLGFILINQIAITSISGEVVTNLYRQLQKMSPFTNTLLITIANDRIGYIIDDAAYDTPTFAAKATPLQRGSAESIILHGLVEMMSRNM
jgi:neutral ceramidase